MKQIVRKVFFPVLLMFLLLAGSVGFSQERPMTPADSLLFHEIYDKANDLRERDLDSALFYFDQLNSFLNEKNYSRARLGVLLDIGNTFLSKGQADRALQTYMEIAADSAMTDASEFRLYAEISIAGIYLSSEDYQSALHQYGQIRRKFEVKDSTYANLQPYCVVYNNEGIAHENLGQFEKAEKLYTKAIEIASKISAPYDLANAYSNMGSLKVKTGALNEGLDWHTKALAIRIENNLSLGIAQSYSHIGAIYLEMQDMDMAEEYLSESIEISSVNGYAQLIIETAQPLKAVYLNTQDYESAFTIQALEMEARSEVLNEESLKNQERLKAQYEFELEKQIEEKNQKFKETVYRFIFGVLVLLVIIAFILYWLQKSKTRQSELENENIQKEKLLLKKELEYKNKKLMSNLMFLLQKNELISGIIQKLREAKRLKKVESEKMIAEVILNLKHHHNNDSWEEFDLYFQEVHSEFYNKLSSKYQLTPNELKLAAFTKLQLSSKEISSLTGQSVRTIDVGRYRLRKKLGLTNAEVNLTTFLNGL